MLREKLLVHWFLVESGDERQIPADIVAHYSLTVGVPSPALVKSAEIDHNYNPNAAEARKGKDVNKKQEQKDKGASTPNLLLITHHFHHYTEIALTTDTIFAGLPAAAVATTAAAVRSTLGLACMDDHNIEKQSLKST